VSNEHQEQGAKERLWSLFFAGNSAEKAAQ